MSGVYSNILSVFLPIHQIQCPLVLGSLFVCRLFCFNFVWFFTCNLLPTNVEGFAKYTFF